MVGRAAWAGVGWVGLEEEGRVAREVAGGAGTVVGGLEVAEVARGAEGWVGWVAAVMEAGVAGCRCGNQRQA